MADWRSSWSGPNSSNLVHLGNDSGWDFLWTRQEHRELDEVDRLWLFIIKASATNDNAGLLYSWSFNLLGIQLLCTLTILVYSATMGLLVLFVSQMVGDLLSFQRKRFSASARVHWDWESPITKNKSVRMWSNMDWQEPMLLDTSSRSHWAQGCKWNCRAFFKRNFRTFQTVTKAITKWKMLAKQKRRLQRLEEAKLKRESELSAFNNLHNNGTYLNGSLFSPTKTTITCGF